MLFYKAPCSEIQASAESTPAPRGIVSKWENPLQRTQALKSKYAFDNIQLSQAIQQGEAKKKGRGGIFPT